LEAFFGCKVEFSADADEIVLPDSIGQVPVSSADPYLNELLIEYCEEALSRRKQTRGSLRPDLENVIALLLPHGKAHAREISRKLGMGERTLARRLSREGLTLTRVPGELKLELGKRYLQDEALAISNIACLLGYHEASSFTHALEKAVDKILLPLISDKSEIESVRSGVIIGE
jgi:AraC-like DNA-binding protein